MTDRVADVPERSRYELAADGSTAFLEYAKAERTITLVHTEVPEALSGKGIGSRLVRGALDDIRAKHLRVVAECEFAAAFIERHPEYRDLLAG